LKFFNSKPLSIKSLNPATQISKEEARKNLDEGAEPGDSLGMKIETSSFGRIAVQMAKQIIIQRVKDAECDNIYEEYKDRKGELVNGFVQRLKAAALLSIWGAQKVLYLRRNKFIAKLISAAKEIRSYMLM